MSINLPTRIAAEVDPIGWLESSFRTTSDLAKNPLGVAKATGDFASRLSRIPGAATRVALGLDGVDENPESVRDRRFSDSTWHENPGYFSIVQAYFAAQSFALDLVDAAPTDAVTSAKTRAMVQFLCDMLSPSNSPLTNPTVLTKAISTGGKSLAQGAKYALSDAVHRKGRPLRVDMDAFTVGENMGCTEGQVVFRNELIELIQYAPQTEQVHAVPLLASPPWINKFYIMDLAPGRSLIEWAVQHGRTVFAISYRNPDSSMSSVTFDDYLDLGIRSALDAIQEITGAPKVDVAAVCLGGAMTAIAAGTGDDRIGDLTLINTILDYSETGDLGLMTDPKTLEKLDVLMAKKGYLDGEDMALTFDMLRANDLIFSYWISRWMLGEAPPAFDLLVWNEDATRMPAAMHTQYLRQLYSENQLAKGELTICDSPVDLKSFSGDVYIVGAINDHIVPWKTSYAGAKLFGNDARYVLSNGGHIAGIVNPPGKKAWTAALGSPEAPSPELPTDPDAWRDAATVTGDSWWDDWVLWFGARAGEMQAPPAMGSDKHPAITPAPGTYVNG
ncbi:PHA/PHB synthase family protein [Gordonia neofelifaecis]|uniref:Poly-beta-hydroxybutyrate polymerase domain-containing protein n=1 Tax=Gordonia neofelifaecis NRRL B-59395 TaxID=644548 RepID=F1YPV0_9ACTN|nr:alpha/beta fold hydrolase [Gordonia neofelifaecis]EGD53280.1 poly-beta-hydroxybutyrate polymerase domain-containing protein [Gordonia neofelifaecis NRRL B-59395]